MLWKLGEIPISYKLQIILLSGSAVHVTIEITYFFVHLFELWYEFFFLPELRFNLFP